MKLSVISYKNLNTVHMYYDLSKHVVLQYVMEHAVNKKNTHIHTHT